MTDLQKLTADAAFAALKLSANCVIALSDAKMLGREQEETIAKTLKQLATTVEEMSDAEQLPPKLAQQLHTLAALLEIPRR